jgi:formylglycine-generating enzyme required for sulfatase activity/class 3 adenylate cyclase
MAEERIQRRLAAILSADVVGYSRLMGRDEAGTLSRLNALRREVIDPAIAAHSGRIVKLMGDGALVEFASAVDAVTCAIEIQRQLREPDADGSQVDLIQFRIGINVGDIIIQGDDILGDGVNIAARIEGIAEPGGVSISEDAWRQVQGKVAANFVDTGAQGLKNIARPVRVYRLDLVPKAASVSEAPGELWRRTSPYRGLIAMTEADSNFFFGRERETVAVLEALAAAPDRLPVLVGNSGVGKSSVAQAGVFACLKRQAWPERADTTAPWPHAFQESRRWCFLKLTPGTEPLRALVESFLDTWQFSSTDPERTKQQSGWVELLRDGRGTLRDMLDATERRYEELERPKPLAFFLYVDQGEELYVRSDEHQRRRFSEILTQGVADPRLYALMSLRADFSGALQNDEPLFDVYHRIEVPPLREVQLREVVNRPAELLSARFETDHLAAYIAQRTAEESTKDAGALPLLSYLLDDMWTRMVQRGDGVLRLPAPAFELAGVLVDRANAFIGSHPDSEETLRRIFTLKLATVREDGEPTRRRALRSEFTDEEWRLVSELADHPNRLLVTVTPDDSATYAEVAHEAIFRRWDKLREWIAAEREFLAWRSGLDGARRAWQATPEGSKNDALLMGFALAVAQTWRAKRAEDLASADTEFIQLSVRRERQTRGRRRRTLALVSALTATIAGLAYAGWSNQAYLKTRTMALMEGIWPKAQTVEGERTLQPKDIFKECADCPEMVVVPAGEFMMGSLPTEELHADNEGPRHRVVIATPLAVSRFAVTFDEWDACVTLGGCTHQPSDEGWGRGTRPVMNVSWDDAQQYLAWLSGRVGKQYRLLSEAEFEYAARAGSTTVYPWGDGLGVGNCAGCGSQWDNKQTAPVGSFRPNAFGLFDMQGNVWQWCEDVWHENYDGALSDGSPWRQAGDPNRRVARGGSWDTLPRLLRSANRNWFATVYRSLNRGFRVGRSLSASAAR